MNFSLISVNGFTDWVSAIGIMVPNLKAIGINAQVKTIDPSTLFDVEPKGNFDMALWFGFSGATPFTFYKDVMSKSTVVPQGTPTFVNFSRYASPNADPLLTQFAATSDVSQQKQIALQLQQTFANEAPVVPLWPGPDYMIFNTAHFTGWPSADNPYAASIVQGSVTPEQLIIMTTITPK
jgi:peptide/nickel transport system substrate-binding protein